VYPGYLIIGHPDVYGNPDQATEIVNNPRALTYAAQAGISWLADCDGCEALTLVMAGAPFVNPWDDPAPWYDPNDPDSFGFLGVVGLDVEGAVSSTRQTSVQMGLGGVGVVGPSYMGPRTLVVRAIAIATDDCSLQYGLAWLRDSYHAPTDPCGGDTLTFFDCCPCICETGDMPPDCWATNYAELRDGPFCAAGHWWPKTYGEMKAGPPDDSYWCNWVNIYRELRDGPPKWSCCADDCVAPYIRHLYSARVTEGPMLLSNPAMHSGGAMAEIEFTIVAADPHIYGPVVHPRPVGAKTNAAPRATPYTSPRRPRRSLVGSR